MDNDILRVWMKGRSGAMRMETIPNAKLIVSKGGFNAPTTSIEIDTISGLSKPQPMEDALISICFTDEMGKTERYALTCRELKRALEIADFDNYKK